MRFRWTCGVGFAALALVFCISSSGLAARLYLDSRPTNLDPSDKYCDLILRELPRQELISIAMDDLGADAVDPSLEIGAQPAADDVVIGLTRRQSRGGHLLHVELFDGANKTIDKIDIPYGFMAHGIARNQSLVAHMDQQFRAKWQAMLAQRLSLSPRPLKWDPHGAAPDEIERYLTSINFQDAYTAALTAHRAIETDGESPARLSALVRAYTHLAEANRDLVSSHPAAFFARAYIYAQSLMRQAPNDPMSYWSRAYLETIYGMVLDAQDDFKKADELAHGAAAPKWAQLAQELLNYDTASLYQQAQNNQDAPMASYFAWRTVAESGLPSLTILFGKYALQHNPNALRTMDSVNWNSSDLDAYESIPQATQILDGMIRGNSQSSYAPEPVRQAVANANDSGFVPAALRAMLKTFESQPHGDDPHLTWGEYASIVHEWHFVQTFTRMWYIDWDTCGDAASEVQHLWPLVQDHRYAALIESFDKSRRASLLPQLRKMHFVDANNAFCALHIQHYLTQKLGILEDEVFHTNWTNYAIRTSDKTAYDVAFSLWQFRNTPVSNAHDDFLYNSQLLDQLAPNHPVALEWLAQTDAKSLQPRAAQIEMQSGDNPVIAYALGMVYSKLGEYQHATTLLAKAAEYAPDRPVYTALADVYFAQKDVNSYLRTWDHYFRTGTEYNHDFTFVRNDIAMKLMSAGLFDKAVPYAQAAANDGYADFHGNYLLALTRAGMYADAERVAAGDGYLPMGQYYRWCVETGHGNLQFARQKLELEMSGLVALRTPGAMLDLAILQYIQGHPDQAIDPLTRAVETEQDGYAAHLLALWKLEQKQPDEAKKILEKRASLPQIDDKTRAYVAAAEQMQRCIADPNALPVCDSALADALADPDRTATRGSVFYLFGRTSELLGHPDDAKKWYRQSLDSLSSTFATRPLAAEALRRLGEEYYK